MIKKFEVGKFYTIDDNVSARWECLAVTSKFVIFKDDMGYEDCEFIEDLTLSRWREVRPDDIRNAIVPVWLDSYGFIKVSNVVRPEPIDGFGNKHLGNIIVKYNKTQKKVELEFKDVSK